MPKPNGRMIETLSDYEEKQRRMRRVTVGEVEDMIAGMVLAVQEFTKEMLARTDALAAHTGYVPPKDETAAQVEAIMDAHQAQQAGVDRD